MSGPSPHVHNQTSDLPLKCRAMPQRRGDVRERAQRNDGEAALLQGQLKCHARWRSVSGADLALARSDSKYTGTASAPSRLEAKTSWRVTRSVILIDAFLNTVDTLVDIVIPVIAPNSFSGQISRSLGGLVLHLQANRVNRPALGA